MKATVLLVEDDELTRVALEDRLSEAGHRVTALPNADDALKRIADQAFDVVITDVRMPGTDGLTFLNAVKSSCPQTVVIVITAYGTIDDAVRAMRTGAYDYLPKPVTGDELLIKLDRALEFRELISTRDRLQKEIEDRYGYANVIGRSSAMKRAFEMAEVVKDIDATVLIHGETGVGKEVLARAIHYNSTRREHPLVPVSCVIFSREILESELFGHEKGAFTGAYRQKIGRFEVAGQGTVFLDDVDDIPIELQVKLLRVLQERQFERVGGVTSIPMRCRIICAAKRDLGKLVEEGKFRKDLYFRMNVVSIELPPLRERREDIPLLAPHFVRKYAEQQGKPTLEIDPRVMQALLDYDWPGNVRELENVIERAVAFAQGPVITCENLPARVCGHQDAQDPVTLRLPASGPLDFLALVEHVEREVLHWALFLSGGNQVKAAEFLKIPRTTLQNRLKRLRIDSRSVTRRGGIAEGSGGV